MRFPGSMEGPGYRRRSAGAVYAAHYGPNMTPMVDVVMVILIFFMASAAVLGPDWFLRSALPVHGRSAVSPKDSPVQVRLALGVRDGRTLVSSTVTWPGPEPATTLPQLTDAPLAACEEFVRGLRRAADPRKLTVVIEPEDAVPYPDVVRMHEMCQQAGVSLVGIGPQEKPAGDRP